ncbi:MULTISPECIES: extracellular solute-binding protein [Rhizobium/Agrobacterium group]|uniref:Extracellular solute-binding protein n=1 Tax=Rhizobium rhizogenes TaxID=359 RepID=A0A546X3D0_RHIRH|nr:MULTISPECIES: extracellular solute-binding protein [Rhizobium/Agrobacterium group]TRA95262.1 extracellular solute-binding protein [Rhizobium rhizogenes]
MKNIMSTVLAVCVTTSIPNISYSRDLTLTSPGGLYTEKMSEHFFKPFAEKEGVKIQVEESSTQWGQIQATIDTGQRPWDIVETEVAEQIRACDEGYLRPLDLKALGLEDVFNPNAVFKCGVGVGITAVTVAYKKQSSSPPPVSINDFFDLTKFPGKRAMRNSPKFSLEFALLADGVTRADLYKTLRTDEGVDRAFRKLDTIKQQLLFWDTSAQSIDMLTGGDVTMSTAYSHRIALQNSKNDDLGMLWDHALLNYDAFGIVADADKGDAAERFLRFYADPQREADFIKAMPMGPAMKKTIDLLPPDLVKLLPVGRNLDTAIDLGTPDAVSFWLDNGDRLTQRWNSWSKS